MTRRYAGPMRAVVILMLLSLPATAQEGFWLEPETVLTPPTEEELAAEQAEEEKPTPEELATERVIDLSVIREARTLLARTNALADRLSWTRDALDRAATAETTVRQARRRELLQLERQALGLWSQSSIALPDLQQRLGSDTDLAGQLQDALDRLRREQQATRQYLAEN